MNTMEFVYAETLKSQYSAFGEFYRLDTGRQQLLCRRRVELVEKDVADVNSPPDAVAILMNPGNARFLQPGTSTRIPVIDADDVQAIARLNQLHPLKSDNTQYQLMRLMQRMAWSHLRLINLSDLCDANSQSFAHRLADLMHQKPGLPHSLLCQTRMHEWDALVMDVARHHAPVIAAWGSNRVLETQALDCIRRLPSLAGLALNTPWFRFASPYRKDQKLNWLNEMAQCLSEHEDEHISIR